MSVISYSLVKPTLNSSGSLRSRPRTHIPFPRPNTTKKRTSARIPSVFLLLLCKIRGLTDQMTNALHSIVTRMRACSTLYDADAKLYNVYFADSRYPYWALSPQIIFETMPADRGVCLFQELP